MVREIVQRAGRPNALLTSTLTMLPPGNGGGIETDVVPSGNVRTSSPAMRTVISPVASSQVVQARSMVPSGFCAQLRLPIGDLTGIGPGTTASGKSPGVSRLK